MATTKERILISLAPEEAFAVRAIAKREGRPRATIAARAIREWLEDEEDRELSLIAEERIRTTTKWLSHEEFWGLVEKKKRG